MWGLPYWWRIPSDAPPIEVHSAFGGLAIYRAARTAGCGYAQDGADCEHVTLHACMRRRNGAKVKLFPSLLVAGRDDRYLRQSLALLAKSVTVLAVGAVVTWAVGWARVLWCCRRRVVHGRTLLQQRSSEAAQREADSKGRRRAGHALDALRVALS